MYELSAEGPIRREGQLAFRGGITYRQMQPCVNTGGDNEQGEAEKDELLRCHKAGSEDWIRIL